MDRDKKIGERLKQERVRLGFNQTVAAKKVGVSREMWGRYEKGAAKPRDVVESKLQGAGFDVDYIFTGIPAVAYEKSIADAGISSNFDSFLDAPNLSDEEKILIRYFRICGREGKNTMLNTGKFASFYHEHADKQD